MQAAEHSPESHKPAEARVPAVADDSVPLLVVAAAFTASRRIPADSRPTLTRGVAPTWYPAGKKGMPGPQLKVAAKLKLPSPPGVFLPMLCMHNRYHNTVEGTAGKEAPCCEQCHGGVSRCCVCVCVCVCVCACVCVSASV